MKQTEAMKGDSMRKKDPQTFRLGKYEIRVTGKPLNGVSLAMLHEINFNGDEPEIKRGLKELGYHHVNVDRDVISFVSK